MNSELVDTLRQISATGPYGFEGLIAKLLAALTGRNFHLAKSGFQAGRDMSMRHLNCNVVAVECKRYGLATELDERSLLGGLVQAVDAIPDLDLWVLAATRAIPSQLYEALHRAALGQGIEFRSISASDGSPSSLEVLCAQAPEVVLAYVEDAISNEEQEDLKQQLGEIAASPQFSETVERLRTEFLSPLIGYDNWRVEQNGWFVDCLRSERKSHSSFGQPVNVEEDGVRLVNREAAWTRLDEWLSGWNETRTPLVILGKESAGKTWAVASRLTQRIQGDEECPPVIFLSSSNVNSTEPVPLLSGTIARRLRTLPTEYWEKRLNRWSSRAVSDAPLFILVLDGINERGGFTWWRTLLEKLTGDPWYDRVAILITCRTAYWQRYFAKLRYLQAITYTLSPYDDKELDDALAYHKLRRSDIPDDLLPLIRRPRHFDLMVKHRERMAESGDITVARLIYEDWKDRFQRKRYLDLDDEAFQDLVRELALKYSTESSYIKAQDIDGLLAPYVDKQVIFEELRTGGILHGSGNRYQVDERLLVYGFGLLLVDELEEESARGEKDLGEVLAEWLEPHAETDIKAAICEFAALHALSLPELPRSAKVALLCTWVNSHHLEPEAEENLPAYLPLDPGCYVELAEATWSNTSENRWAQELLMQSFLRWRDLPHVADELRSACERWLGFVHIYGSPYQRGKTAEDAEKVRQEISDRIGHELQPGQFPFAGYRFTAIEDDGLLRLGRAALAVISHLPRGPFMRGVATGCLAEAVMGRPDKYDLFRWVMLTSPQPVWAEVRKEVEDLLAVDHIATKQAAYRLLSFEGSEKAYQLQQTLPEDLFPSDTLSELHRKDPCTSGFTWSLDDCETCLQRSDLGAKWIARQLKPHCVNPDLSVPDDLGSRLEPLAERISPNSIWTVLATTAEDLDFETYEPALCAYAPDAIAGLVRRICGHVNERKEVALQVLSQRLREHCLILGHKEQQSIHDAWMQLQDKCDAWSREEELAERFLFRLVLKGLDAEGQLVAFLKRPSEALDWDVYKRSFLPTTNWDRAWKALTDAPSVKAAERILWFLSAHPDVVPKEDVYARILPLLGHESSFARALVLQILYTSGDMASIKEVIGGAWAWDTTHSELENCWGSLLLCKYGTTLPYSELRCRVHAAYLGYAIRCQGMQTGEVDQYAEDIHRIWLRIGAEAPDLPIDFPPTEVEAGIAEDEAIVMRSRVGLSRSMFSRSVTFLSRHAFWGGMDKGHLKELLGNLTSVDEQLQTLSQIVRQTIEQQIEAGNTWFAQGFHTDGLDQVLHQRPDLVNEWLEGAFAEHPEGVRRLHLGRSFYGALCTMLLRNASDKGAALYWRLEEVGSAIRVIDRNSKIRLLDYALFEAPPIAEMKSAWERKIEGCDTDRELMGIAFVAQHGSGQEWLWSRVKQGVQSSVPLEKSRSMTLLGFMETEEAAELISTLLEKQPNTWVKRLLETSLQRWQTNAWAKHWFRRFLSADDDVTAWASFRLFLQRADSRFWLWREQVTAELDSGTKAEERWTFFKDNLDTLENRIRKNEQSLERHFLGQKVLQSQAWPWM